jgi:hypothetical protein
MDDNMKCILQDLLHPYTPFIYTYNSMEHNKDEQCYTHKGGFSLFQKTNESRVSFSYQSFKI